MKLLLSRVARPVCRAASRTRAIVCALAFALFGASAFAQESQETAFDVSFATQFLGKLAATITDFWTQNKTSLMTILGVLVVITLIWLGIRLFKRATSRA